MKIVINFNKTNTKRRSEMKVLKLMAMPLFALIFFVAGSASAGEAPAAKIDWSERATMIEKSLKDALKTYEKEGSRAGSEAVIDVYFNIYEEEGKNFEEFIEHGLSHEDAEIVGDGFKEIRTSMRKNVSAKKVEKMVEDLSEKLHKYAKELKKVIH